MNRKICVLVLGLALVPAVSMAQDKKDVQLGSINTYPNCNGVLGNIVLNCGFETGDFTFWTQIGDLGFTGVNTNASHHYGVPFPSAWGAYFGPQGALGCIYQDVNTPAFHYDISLWVTNAGAPNQFTVQWNGVFLTSASNVFDFGWTQLAYPNVFTNPAVSRLEICFQNPPNYFYLDDIVVVQTPGTTATATK
jgi:hypothetical protein